MKDKKQIGKKVLASTAVTVAALVAAQIGYSIPYHWGTHYIKPQNQIVRDAQSLGIDMDVMTHYDSGFLRLKFPEKKPVYVTCDDAIDSSYIEHAINYYNKVFETIDDGYRLELVKASEVKKNDVCIRFTNATIEEEGTYGKHDPECLYKGKGVFIKEALITLDWDEVKNMDDIAIHYVIIHELAHIKYMNHQKEFWDEVAKYCPYYKAYRTKCKKEFVYYENY